MQVTRYVIDVGKQVTVKQKYLTIGKNTKNYFEFCSINLKI